MLDAELSVREMASIVGCSEKRVRDVRRIKLGGESLERQLGSGGHKRTRSEDFLVGLTAEVEGDVAQSQRHLAKELQVSKSTIVRALKDTGLVSVVRRRR